MWSDPRIRRITLDLAESMRRDKMRRSELRTSEAQEVLVKTLFKKVTDRYQTVVNITGPSVIVEQGLDDHKPIGKRVCAIQYMYGARRPEITDELIEEFFKMLEKDLPKGNTLYIRTSPTIEREKTFIRDLFDMIGFSTRLGVA